MKSNRRLYKVLAIAAGAAIALSACSSGGTASAGAAGGSKKVVFIPGIVGIGFYNSVGKGVEDQAKKYGWSYEQQGSTSSFSASAQTPVVRAVCGKKPDVLVIAPTDPVALRAPIQECLNAGVKVVVVDTTLQDASGLVSEVGADNEQGGKLAADFISPKLKPNTPVDTVSGQPEAITQHKRVDGFQTELAAKNPSNTVLPKILISSTSAAQTETSAALVAHPDMGGIFDATGSCTGSQAAIAKQSAAAPLLVCFDSSKAQDALLKAGKVAALVVQPAQQEGSTAVEYAWDSFNGKQSDIKPSVVLNDVVIPADKANDPTYQQYYYQY